MAFNCGNCSQPVAWHESTLYDSNYQQEHTCWSQIGSVATGKSFNCRNSECAKPVAWMNDTSNFDRLSQFQNLNILVSARTPAGIHSCMKS